MKKFMKILALVLACMMMLGVFAACGNPEQGGETGGTQTGGETGGTESGGGQTGGEASGGTEPGTGTGGETGGEEAEPPVPLRWLMPDLGYTTQEGRDLVGAAISDYVLEKLNIDLDIFWVGSYEYQNQMMLDVASGVSYDIIQSIYTFPEFVNQGLYLDITELLPEYAPETYELMKDTLSATTVDGKVYAIPVNRNTIQTQWICINQGWADKAGWTEDDVRAIKTWTQLEALAADVLPVLEEGQEITSTTTAARGLDWVGSGIILADDEFANSYVWDTLGDNTGAIMTDLEGNVFNTYYTEDFEKVCQRAADWYQKGYVWKDSTFAAMESPEFELIYMYPVDGDPEVRLESRHGERSMTVINCGNRLLSGAGYQNSCMGVSSSTEEPEAALSLLNLLYNDPDFMDLVVWGIEGVSWRTEPDGTAFYYTGSSETCIFRQNDWMFGNTFILTPWAGDGADKYITGAEIMENAVPSPYYGFSINIGSMVMKMALTQNVVNQYFQRIVSGEYTPEMYEEFCNALATAGADELVAYYQDELTAWLNG